MNITELTRKLSQYNPNLRVQVLTEDGEAHNVVIVEEDGSVVYLKCEPE